MNMVKKGDYVIAPVGCKDYLTVGKRYEVVEGLADGMITIKDDSGIRIDAFLKGSAHLNGGDWILEKDLKEFMDVVEPKESKINELLLETAIRIFTANDSKVTVKSAVKLAKELINECKDYNI